MPTAVLLGPAARFLLPKALLLLPDAVLPLPTAVLSVPLSLIIARLPAPLLLLGAAGYGAYRFANVTRASRKARARPRRQGSPSAVAKS